MKPQSAIKKQTGGKIKPLLKKQQSETSPENLKASSERLDVFESPIMIALIAALISPQEAGLFPERAIEKAANLIKTARVKPKEEPIGRERLVAAIAKDFPMIEKRANPISLDEAFKVQEEESIYKEIGKRSQPYKTKEGFLRELRRQKLTFENRDIKNSGGRVKVEFTSRLLVEQLFKKLAEKRATQNRNRNRARKAKSDV